MIQATSQQWLALGRRARSKPHGLKCILSFWTSNDEWPVVLGIMQNQFDSVQYLWTQHDSLLQGIPQSIVQSFADTTSTECVGSALQVKEENQQLMVFNTKYESESWWTSADGELTSNDPALILLAQDYEEKNPEPSENRRQRLLYELARSHVCRSVAPLPLDEDVGLTSGDNNISSSSCARARRTILQTQTPVARNRGPTFKETTFLQFGAVTGRGLAHTHANTQKFGSVLAAIHHLASKRRDQHAYLAAGIIVGQSPWHQDLSVVGKSSTVSLGQYEGGLLEILSDTQQDSTLVDTFQKWHTFMAWSPHRVTDYSGFRVAVALYTPQKAHVLPRSVWIELWRSGFPVLQFLSEEIQRLMSTTTGNNESEAKQYLEIQSDFMEDYVASTLLAFPVLEHHDDIIVPDAGLPTIAEDPPPDNLDEHLDVLPSEELLDLAKDDQMRRHLTNRDEQKQLPKTVSVREPTAAQKAAIHKAHINLGHPRPQEFLRALRLAGISLALR
eukprot:6492158-Amphidinium_carterae.1